ncbi:MAG: peptidase [Gemmatimonadetes bacterium]|nr:peptidase [Gemmatimonadota bacterium]
MVVMKRGRTPLGIAALVMSMMSVSAHRQPSPIYGCALARPARVGVADPLGVGAWTNGGGFTDSRAIGIDSARNRVLAPHGALDLEGVPDEGVHAVRGGTVAIASTAWPHLGNTIVIDHGDGAYSIYAFLGSLAVADGATVVRGAMIGRVGFSGDALVMKARHADARPRMHFALIKAARAGLAAPGQSLRRLTDAPDAWPAGFDQIATPVDPHSALPAACWE